MTTVQLYDLAIAATDIGLAFLAVCVLVALSLLAKSFARPRYRCDTCGYLAATFDALVDHDSDHGACRCGPDWHHPACRMLRTGSRTA